MNKIIKGYEREWKRHERKNISSTLIEGEVTPCNLKTQITTLTEI